VRIQLTEVVLRDGLQDEPVVVGTEDKCAIVAALVAAGVSALEVASFVSPTRVPQLADAEALLAALPKSPGVRRSGIALNARGAHRASAATGLDEVRLVVSAGAGHSRANAGRETEQAIAEFVEALPALAGLDVSAAVSTAFECPYDGPVAPARLVSIVRQLHDAGITSVGLADTLGTASTERVLRSVGAVRDALPDLDLNLHLHNAHGQALATVDAALLLGVHRFDSSLGGLGRCPFAPGAHGNLATEQLVAHLHADGITTGIDEPALARASTVLRAALARGASIGS
jgi:hydroxymethylglutaryl-CoA lyase